jgi:broad specificity phosphatase PhoE
MIYLLRHGETVWNTAGRFQGKRDSSLTKRGLAQADEMGTLLLQHLAGTEHQFKGYVSPLGRAQETARRVSKVIPLTFVDEPRLMEISVGTWDGMSLYEIGVEFPGALDGTDAFDWFFRSPDGETFDDACKRVRSWLSDVSTPAVAITHGLASRLVRGVYLGMSKREMLELPVPQNGFYRLATGHIDFIDRTQPSDAGGFGPM